MAIQEWAAPPASFGYCLGGSPSYNEGNSTAQSPGGCLLVVRNVAGNALTYSVGAYNSPGGTYELFITVEQLM